MEPRPSALVNPPLARGSICAHLTPTRSPIPRPTTPVKPSLACGSICTHVMSTRPPVQKASTPPPCISVEVSPSRVQRTPTRSFVSRGVSPAVPFERFLPPDLAAWWAAIPLETQISQSTRPLVRIRSHISITESGSEADGPQKRSRTRVDSQEFVPETQVESDDEMPVCPHFQTSRIYLLIRFLV
jgi:hypothetical protein